MNNIIYIRVSSLFALACRKYWPQSVAVVPYQLKILCRVCSTRPPKYKQPCAPPRHTFIFILNNSIFDIRNNYYYGRINESEIRNVKWLSFSYERLDERRGLQCFTLIFSFDYAHEHFQIYVHTYIYIYVNPSFQIVCRSVRCIKQQYTLYAIYKHSETNLQPNIKRRVKCVVKCTNISFCVSNRRIVRKPKNVHTKNQFVYTETNDCTGRVRAVYIYLPI